MDLQRGLPAVWIPPLHLESKNSSWTMCTLLYGFIKFVQDTHTILYCHQIPQLLQTLFLNINTHEHLHIPETLSRTIPTSLPTIANPGNTLPRCSQPWDKPFTLVFHHQDTLFLHHYLLWSCYPVIPCFLISLILYCTHCSSPGYLVHLS